MTTVRAAAGIARQRDRPFYLVARLAPAIASRGGGAVIGLVGLCLTLGHVPIRMVSNGAVHRAVHAWIADECSKSTVKNSLAVLVRVMEQAYRDGLVDRNPARITGWQREYQRAEDELDDPRSLALPDWSTLVDLAEALVVRSSKHYAGWGDVVVFAACTAARIGEA